MPLPNLSDAQIARVIQQVAEYIERQRRNFRRRAVPIDVHQMAAMRPFFPVSALESARIVVLARERVSNPPFYGELVKMGFEAGSLPDFAPMAAVTFVDTVVSHEPFTDRLLFHELVHVVQYQKLGLEGFAVRYVNGFLSGGSYEAVPLEKNACELDARFAAAPADVFPVEVEVQQWIDRGMF